MGEINPVVLIVDDDESVRKSMKRLLASNGYKTLAFSSAEDLLLSNYVRGSICLLLDICLPGISGIELYAKLVASGVTCPVIFMTAHEDPVWQDRAREAGAIAFLRKPFGERCLLAALAIAADRIAQRDASP